MREAAPLRRRVRDVPPQAGPPQPDRVGSRCWPVIVCMGVLPPRALSGERILDSVRNGDARDPRRISRGGESRDVRRKNRVIGDASVTLCVTRANK